MMDYVFHVASDNVVILLGFNEIYSIVQLMNAFYS